jgi:catechol 2,3-dioxygenase-like lactoylglutathione lyase family enzyme
MLTGLAHVDLACRDVERSAAFYLAVLGPLGLQAPPVTFEGEQGETINYLRFPEAGSGSIGLRAASVAQEFALYAPGLHHIAFAVATPDDVRVAHEGAVREGAEIVHPPTPFPRYHPDYFATFFLDPDGFRVEVRSR